MNWIKEDKSDEVDINRLIKFLYLVEINIFIFFDIIIKIFFDIIIKYIYI